MFDLVKEVQDLKERYRSIVEQYIDLFYTDEQRRRIVEDLKVYVANHAPITKVTK